MPTLETLSWIVLGLFFLQLFINWLIISSALDVEKKIDNLDEEFFKYKQYTNQTLQDRYERELQSTKDLTSLLGVFDKETIAKKDYEKDTLGLATYINLDKPCAVLVTKYTLKPECLPKSESKPNTQQKKK